MIINKEKYKVTIILATHNRKHIIRRAIQSVSGQTYRNYELIITDDGSKDGTFEHLKPILSRNTNIKYIYHTNRGTALSLNAGITIAQGKYITFIDSDDEYEKRHIELRVKYSDRNRDVDLTYSKVKVIGKESDYFVPDARNKSRLIHIDECITGATFFGKAEVFRELNGFKDLYGYDYEFFRRAVKKYTVEMLDLPTYKYYKDNKDSITNKMKKIK